MGPCDSVPETGLRLLQHSLAAWPRALPHAPLSLPTEPSPAQTRTSPQGPQRAGLTRAASCCPLAAAAAMVGPKSTAPRLLHSFALGGRRAGAQPGSQPRVRGPAVLTLPEKEAVPTASGDAQPQLHTQPLCLGVEYPGSLKPDGGGWVGGASSCIHSFVRTFSLC